MSQDNTDTNTATENMENEQGQEEIGNLENLENDVNNINEENDSKEDEEIEQAVSESVRQKIQVSARIRKILPWEDPNECVQYEDKAVGITKNTTSLIGETIINFYQFDEVFRENKENEDVFEELCKPLCETTLDKGYNSILIAYGQTGSGKTYTMLGKKDEYTVGVLPKCLQYFLNDERVENVTLKAVEIYGISTQRIDVFDLLDAENVSNRKWQDKNAINIRVGDLHSQFITTDIADNDSTINLVNEIQQASHFAPTGKNPQSSRGHVVFIVTIHRKDKIVSNLVAVDLAGSEGESALTSSFAKKVSKKALKTRRLEAGIINYGLSQLQKILQEIKTKSDVSDFKESGLRKVLHPYINGETFISVLFTLSPSNTNIKSTRSTLRVANTVSMIEIIPKTVTYEPTKDEIITDLNQQVKEQRQHIANLEKQNEEAVRTSTVAKEKLVANGNKMKDMTQQLNEMRETETSMIKYAEILKRQLSEKTKMSETETEQTKANLAKLQDIEKELNALKQKEEELVELNEAIETAIREHNNDTVFDDIELKTDEISVDKETEINNNDSATPKLKVDPISVVRASMKFNTFRQDKEKQLAELNAKLAKLEKIEETAKEKDQKISELEAKLDEIQNADDIQLDIADNADNELVQKDAKIAELEKRCEKLQKEADKNAACACVIL